MHKPLYKCVCAHTCAHTYSWRGSEQEGERERTFCDVFCYVIITSFDISVNILDYFPVAVLGYNTLIRLSKEEEKTKRDQN